MNVTIHRGTREIGGSCVEVRSLTTRLILDVGLPLVDANRDPFDSLKALRSTRDELSANGTIPQVPGLFTNEVSPPNAILVSHAHLDHTGLLHHTRPEIPIYATQGTSKMMLAGSVFAGRPGLDQDRVRLLRPGSPVTIGDFTVTPFAVDHSTFGCLALLLDADGKTLLYSGDLRTHGRKPGMVKTLVDAISSRHLDALVIEGTHLGNERENLISEFDLERKIVDLVRTAPGLVLAAFSPQDVDRMVTMYRAALRNGRIFVVDAYAAFVLHLVASEAKIPRPTQKHGIRVYYNASFRRRGIEKLTKLFEADRIELCEITASPEKYVMVFRPSMTALDFDARLPNRVRVLYSHWAGYLKNSDWVELQSQVNAANGDFFNAHASGHIYIKDLIGLVRALNASVIVPIHTFEPVMFSEQFGNTILLRDGQSYAV